jgi:hypothetical protein
MATQLPPTIGRTFYVHVIWAFHGNAVNDFRDLFIENDHAYEYDMSLSFVMMDITCGHCNWEPVRTGITLGGMTNRAGQTDE